MGISKGAAALLFESSKKLKFKGSLLQIGNQDISFFYKELLNLAHKYHFKIKHKKNTKIKFDSKFFFNFLGYSKVKSIDIDNYENADYIYDLNYPIDKKFHNKFDSIYDGGSLEHIFNVSQAMFNLTKMVKKNGTIMHLLPCNNYIDHGFYSFSPTFLYDYYEQNNFKILKFYLVKQNYNLKKDGWSVYEYSREKMNYYDLWNWKKSRVMLWAVVKKTKSINKIIFPKQYKYILSHKTTIKKGQNIFRKKIKKLYPKIYNFLKINKHIVNKIIAKTDKKDVELNKKPKLIFKC